MVNILFSWKIIVYKKFRFSFCMSVFYLLVVPSIRSSVCQSIGASVKLSLIIQPLCSGYSEWAINLVGKPASQSSLYNGNNKADVAVDGRICEGMSHTKPGGKAWWKVDMEEDQEISKVRSSKCLQLQSNCFSIFQKCVKSMIN